MVVCFGKEGALISILFFVNVKVLLKKTFIVLYLKNSYIFVPTIKTNIMKNNLKDFALAFIFMTAILTLTLLIINNF